MHGVAGAWDAYMRCQAKGWTRRPGGIRWLFARLPDAALRLRICAGFMED